jgi:hypothetical protein
VKKKSFKKKVIAAPVEEAPEAAPAAAAAEPAPAETAAAQTEESTGLTAEQTAQV